MVLNNLSPAEWKKIKTENGNFLVKTPNGDVFYTDSDGNLIRETEEPDEEWQFALSVWQNPDVTSPDLSFLMKIKDELRLI